MDQFTSLLVLLVLYRWAFGPRLFAPLDGSAKLPLGFAWSRGRPWARVQGTKVKTGREWNIYLTLPVMLWRRYDIALNRAAWQLVCVRASASSAPYWFQLRLSTTMLPCSGLLE